MKNLQIIDAAENCTYSIFQATDAEFDLLFSEAGQDIEYAEDLHERSGDAAQAALAAIWQRPIEKTRAMGIHGTLYFGMQHRKKFYNGKRERDVDPAGVNEAQRRMHRQV